MASPYIRLGVFNERDDEECPYALILWNKYTHEIMVGLDMDECIAVPAPFVPQPTAAIAADVLEYHWKTFQRNWDIPEDD